MWSVKDKRDRSASARIMPEFAMPDAGSGDSHLFHIFSEREWNDYPFAAAEDVEKFLDLKAGLFLHVGLSAIGMTELGWSRHTHKLPDTKTGSVPDEIYDGWAKEITFPAFNAEDWAETAVLSGAKYVVIITKHHDGFHMWDTSCSQHKITNSPFGKDYLRLLIDAFRRRGLKIGLYFSQRDWYHPDYEPVTNERFNACGGHPPYRINGKPIPVTPKHNKYICYMKKAVEELVTQYGKIDFFWWDSLWWGGMFEKEMWDAEATEAIIRERQPHILINNRNSLVGDFDTPELRLGFFQTERPWEACIPLSTGWSYKGTPPKSLKELVRLLIGCLCGGGNLLLSIGCTPNGSIAKMEKERLYEYGKFIHRYEESIYGTRAVFLSEDGSWGITKKKNIYYVHALGEGKIDVELPDKAVKRAVCLTGENCSIEIACGRLHISFSDGEEPETIVKIECL